jgi:thioredoxin-dependent peroxiredoxin
MDPDKLSGLTNKDFATMRRPSNHPSASSLRQKRKIVLTRGKVKGYCQNRSTREEPMQVNDIVENFTLQNQDGRSVSLSDFKGKPVVLFFYPRADTPGCTIESCGFRDAFERFQKAGIVVLGISRDTVKDQKKFKDKYDLPYDLLADPEMELINRYDLVKPKNMYGKLVKGVKRTTYLVGPDQRLVHIFEEVKPQGHAEEVLALLKKQAKK